MTNPKESDFTHLEKLRAFRQRSFDAFGPRAEFSDATWFATWSGGAVGGRLARVILNNSVMGALTLLREVVIAVMIQTLIRCRQVVFSLPMDWLNDKTTAVLQTWRDNTSILQIPIPQTDKFFGSFFTDDSMSGRLAIIDLTTDNIDSHTIGNTFLIGRASKLSVLNFRVLSDVMKILIFGLPGLVKLSTQSRNMVELISSVIVWLSIANQRSRHSFSLFSYLLKHLKPILSEYKNPPVLYLPYETHPEQNVLAAVWQAAGGKTVGYVHGTMLTFPAHYIRPLLGAVNTLWVHGTAYKDILFALGWVESSIKIINTLRFNKTRPQITLPSEGSVYFPYWSGNLLFPITQLRRAVNKQLINIKVIKPHPVTGLPKKLERLFNGFIKTCAGSSSLIKGQIIAIGPVSVPLEELERDTNYEIIHIPISSACWDSYSFDIWRPYLDAERLDLDIHAYRLRLKKPGSFIKFS